MKNLETYGMVVNKSQAKYYFPIRERPRLNTNSKPPQKDNIIIEISRDFLFVIFGILAMVGIMCMI